jgi:transcriptional regulator with XRE-family HTH domain
MNNQKLENKILTMSCSELAKQTNIDKGCWSRYLNGEFTPSTSNLMKISGSLHITIEEVLDGIEARKSTKA